MPMAVTSISLVICAFFIFASFLGCAGAQVFDTALWASATYSALGILTISVRAAMCFASQASPLCCWGCAGKGSAPLDYRVVSLASAMRCARRISQRLAHVTHQRGLAGQQFGAWVGHGFEPVDPAGIVLRWSFIDPCFMSYRTASQPVNPQYRSRNICSGCR